MWLKKANFLLIFCILFVFIKSSIAIVCWDCKSITDQNCGNPFKEENLRKTDCTQLNSNEQKCRKITYTVGGTTQIIRDCLIEDHITYHNASISLCEHDNCNSAHTQVPMFITSVTIPLTVVISNLLLRLYQK